MLKRYFFMIKHYEATDKILFGLLIGFFILSRIAYFILGVRFDDSPLHIFWQYVDPILLKEQLFESIFYLHSQAPIFNSLLGFFLKISASNFSLLFWGFHILLGLNIACLLFLILKKYCSSSTSLCIAIIFSCNPITILYENWLFYPYFIAFLIIFLVFSYMKFIETQKVYYIYLLSPTLLLICLTKASYSLVFFIAIFLFVIFSIKVKKLSFNTTKVYLPFVLSFLILFMFYLKNYYLFDTFSLSSWGGLQLWFALSYQYHPDEIKNLSDTGVISEFPKTLSDNFSAYSPISQNSTLTGLNFPNVPVLQNRYKSSGSVNYNYWEYIIRSKNLLHDSSKLIAYNPIRYCKIILFSLMVYTWPGDEADPFNIYSKKIESLLSLFKITYLEIAVNLNDKIYKFGITIITLIIIYPSYIIQTSYNQLKHRDIQNFTLIALFILLIIGFNLLMDILVVPNDPNRQRFEVEPLLYIAFAFLLSATRRYIKTKWA
jgi:hypothetical protein